MDTIFDIDGTLLDIQHRVKFVRDQPKDWKTFRDPELKKNDKPIRPVIFILNATLLAGFRVVIASGRLKSEEEDTRKQLRLWIPDIDSLPFYMRSDSDYRPDDEVKKGMLIKMREDGYNPSMVFDDRPSVVRMWRAEGLVVADVGNPDLGEF